MKKWSRGYLRRAFRGHKVVVGNYPMRFDDYLAYLDGARADDAPLYLFDCAFARKAPQLAADYTVFLPNMAHHPQALIAWPGCVQFKPGPRDWRSQAVHQQLIHISGCMSGAVSLFGGPICRARRGCTPRLQVCSHAILQHLPSRMLILNCPCAAIHSPLYHEMGTSSACHSAAASRDSTRHSTALVSLRDHSKAQSLRAGG